jgi:hypothetical protein
VKLIVTKVAKYKQNSIFTASTVLNAKKKETNDGSAVSQISSFLETLK